VLRVNPNPPLAAVAPRAAGNKAKRLRQHSLREIVI
jgi:hypothetical protein